MGIHHFCEKINAKIACLAKPCKEVREANQEVQSTGFQENADKKLELFREGIVTSTLGCFPNPPNQYACP